MRETRGDHGGAISGEIAHRLNHRSKREKKGARGRGRTARRSARPRRPRASGARRPMGRARGSLCAHLCACTCRTAGSRRRPGGARGTRAQCLRAARTTLAALRRAAVSPKVATKSCQARSCGRRGDRGGSGGGGGGGGAVSAPGAGPREGRTRLAGWEGHQREGRECTVGARVGETVGRGGRLTAALRVVAEQRPVLDVYRAVPPVQLACARAPPAAASRRPPRPPRPLMARARPVRAAAGGAAERRGAGGRGCEATVQYGGR